MRKHRQLAFGIHTAHALPIVDIISVLTVAVWLNTERYAARKYQFDVFRESLRCDIREKNGIKACPHMEYYAP